MVQTYVFVFIEANHYAYQSQSDKAESVKQVFLFKILVSHYPGFNCRRKQVGLYLILYNDTIKFK